MKLALQLRQMGRSFREYLRAWCCNAAAPRCDSLSRLSRQSLIQPNRLFAPAPKSASSYQERSIHAHGRVARPAIPPGTPALCYSRETPASRLLQRWLRIGYEHARALREALRGDALDYHADTDTWHIHPNADRQTDYLLADKLQRARTCCKAPR